MVIELIMLHKTEWRSYMYGVTQKMKSCLEVTPVLNTVAGVILESV
jgi:hypothetical protein